MLGEYLILALQHHHNRMPPTPTPPSHNPTLPNIHNPNILNLTILTQSRHYNPITHTQYYIILTFILSSNILFLTRPTENSSYTYGNYEEGFRQILHICYTYHIIIDLCVQLGLWVNYYLFCWNIVEYGQSQD